MSNQSARQPAEELAALLGDDAARAAIVAGWDALKTVSGNRPDLCHPGIGDFIAATVLLGALSGSAADDAPIVDAVPVRLRGTALEQAKRRLFARIIASAHLLDVPFTGAPDQSPWSRVKADMHALNAALREHERGEVDRLRAEAERLRCLVRDLSDSDPCWFDHHGGCQAHGYLSLGPGEKCPQSEAQEIVAELASGDSRG
jgi:hypothetical protein